MPETRTVKGFLEDELPLAEGDFDQPRYDHFDTSPYSMTAARDCFPT